MACESHSIFCSPLGGLKTGGTLEVADVADVEGETSANVVPVLHAARTTSSRGRRRFTLHSVATTTEIDTPMCRNIASTLRK